MQVPAAFAAVVLIWSTTPLAIQWSSEGQGFLFSVFSRMMLGVVLCLLIVKVMRIALPWHKKACEAYLAATVSIYASMLCVYWGAQYIPSGVISVLFGLTPIVTGVLAVIWLGESKFTTTRIIGLLLAVAGLAIVFGADFSLGEKAMQGTCAVLLSIALAAVSTVWLKRTNTGFSPVAITTGALIISTPLYALTWLLFDGQLPTEIPARALSATVYLGTIGSVAGFILFFYLLKNMEASRATLLTLITPVLALLLGHALNNERVGIEVWLGAGMILVGLMSHEWGDILLKKNSAKIIDR
ncbi:Permease of the drug/metabolite transporter (DMT) superfamily [hydrothermal vent metagenome]|uniref:Permease of the drug/metabolite transporter (DMT) superfamily n=1 Tax=hydrothermal vent metagenome TaxID=652676 RepID=A0A3B0ZD19_9ZZZZ